MANLTQVGNENFDELVLQSELPVMVDLTAVWWTACKTIAGAVERIAGENQEKLRVLQLDVDQNQDVAIKYGVMSIPTMLFFKGGEIVDQVIGASESKIEEAVQKLIADWWIIHTGPKRTV